MVVFQWAQANPHKVRQANRDYRRRNRMKTNRQAAERMKRMRWQPRQHSVTV